MRRLLITTWDRLIKLSPSLIGASLGLLLFVASPFVHAITEPGTQLQDIGVRPVLGTKVDFNLSFIDSSGQKVQLKDVLLPNRPILFVPVYYKCPRLCGLVSAGLVTLLNELPLVPGKDFQIITVSFNPEEGADLAAKSKQTQLGLLGKPPVGDGWRFLAGDEANIPPLMQQIGFHYAKDGPEFAHGAGIIVVTPDGKVSQYFTGIDFPAWDVKLSLVEASQGGIGTAIDHIALYCFRFDPLRGKYTWAVTGLLRIGGAVTIVLLGGLIAILVWRERSRAASFAAEHNGEGGAV